MKKAVMYSTVFTAAVVLSGGCAAGVKERAGDMAAMQGSVFQESTRVAAERGSAVLVIKAAFKTHSEDHFILESRDSVHGKQQYPVVINISGQGATWAAPGSLEASERYVNGARQPEGGEGVRYTLERTVKLKTGRHAVYFALPQDEAQLELVVDLTDGRVHTIEFKPRYRQDRLRKECFLNGLAGFDAFLDGAPVRQQSAASGDNRTRKTTMQKLWDIFD